MEKTFGLPEEFASLDKDLKDLTDELDRIDEVIENMPRDRGPSNEFTPPGFRRMPEVSRADKIADLERNKKIYVEDMKQRVQAELKHADKDTTKEVTEKSNIRLEQNPYIKISRQEFEMLKHKVMSRNLEQSQDYTRVKLVYEKYGNKTLNRDRDLIRSTYEKFLDNNRHPDSMAQLVQEAPYVKIDQAPDKQIEESISSYMKAAEYKENAIEITGKDFEPGQQPDTVPEEEPEL